MTLITEFICVAQKMSITAAARELNMSQPNLSRHMQHLERELGFQLFYTKNRRIHLTPAGRHFYNNASVMHGRFERLVENCRNLEQRGGVASAEGGH